LVLASSSVVGGNSVSGTVTIADSASVVNVTLQSSDPTAKPPSFVNIPSGQNSASFTITTAAVTAARTITITAKYGSLTQSATLTVTPPASATLTGVTVSPAYVTGGTNATGTVTLGAAAPVGGVNVFLKSNSPYAQVPPLVTVPQGATTASFNISTTHVTSTQSVTITATAAGVTETAVLTVQ